MGYESAIHTKLLATNCCFCGRPLEDPESIQRGCGPDCADKYGIGTPTGAPDVAMLESVKKSAPALFRQYVFKDDPSPYLITRRSVWQAAMAATYGGPEAGAVVAAAVNATAAAGFYVVSRQIAFNMTPHNDKAEVMETIGSGRKQVKVRRGLALEQKGSTLFMFTPYNEPMLPKVRAMGARFDGEKKAWTLPATAANTIKIVNLFVEFYPGTAFMGPEGIMIPVPAAPLALPPEPGRATGAPTKDTGEAPANRPTKLGDIKVGDIVVGPDGKQAEVGWVGNSRGELRVGIRPAGAGRGSLTFMSFAEVRYLTPAEAQAKSSKAEPTVAPEPARLSRPVPEIMFPYQVEGVRWLDAKGSGIVADEMGLGKTMQSAVASDPPVIVVCPATLRTNWAREFARWRPDLSTTIINGRAALPASGYSANVIIINYDVLPAHLEALSKIKATTLIADEAHYVKTLKYNAREGSYSGSARAAALATLARGIKRKFLLTGTPILNRTLELWPLLHIIDPKQWDNFFKFGIRYCAGFEKDIGYGRTAWDFSGTSNVEELHEIISGNYLLRRRKEDVLTQLPQKSRRTVVVGMEPSVAKEYEKAVAKFLRWVAENGGPDAALRAQRAETLTKISALRALAAAGKTPAAIEWVTEFLDSSGRPLVVMGHHQETLRAIQDHLEKSGIRVAHIYGSDGAAARQRAVDDFQSGAARVFIGSIMAAGVGITLTAASDMLIVERVWRPGDLVQAEDRIHRIGQTRGVQITYMDCENTVDSTLASLLADKSKTAAGVIDGIDMDESQALATVMGEMFRAMSMRSNARGGGGIVWEATGDWTTPSLF